MSYAIASLHIFIIALSNVLVQYPFQLWGYNTTYGAFTYPVIFILSDLTTRLYGKEKAMRVIMLAMMPALVISFLFSSYSLSHAHFAHPILLSFRVALASLTAYALGQCLDITIFAKLRQNKRWYIAPAISSLFGNIFDTYCFFFVAFFYSSHPFMAHHWLEVANVDLVFKCLISILAFVPAYGLVLSLLKKKLVLTT